MMQTFYTTSLIWLGAFVSKHVNGDHDIMGNLTPIIVGASIAI
jgi:hypothetical protein